MRDVGIESRAIVVCNVANLSLQVAGNGDDSRVFAQWQWIRGEVAEEKEIQAGAEEFWNLGENAIRVNERK